MESASASVKKGKINAEKEKASTRKSWVAWDGVVPSGIRTFCIVWETVKYMTQFYLCIRQYNVLEARRGLPKVLYGKLPPETFEKARQYEKDKLYLEMFSCFYFTAYEYWNLLYAGNTFVWFISGPVMEKLGVWPQDWDQETGESIVFIILNVLIGNTVMVPLELWRNFYIEERYDFNRMTLLQYFVNLLKVVIFECIWGVICALAIIWIVRETGKYFFVWLWLFCFLWLMFTVAVYPNLIAPLFDRYTPLRKGRLRDRLNRLAQFLGFPLEDILVLHQNWRSGHRNAYFIGLLSSKRVILYDTLLEGYPEADVDDAPKRRRTHRHSVASDDDQENKIHTPLPSRIRRSIDAEREHEENDRGNSHDEDEIKSSLTPVPSRIRQSLGQAEHNETEPEPSTLRSRKSVQQSVSNDLKVSKDKVSRASMYDMGFTEYEIEAIVARLMGHWVLGHAVREIIFPEISLFLFFFIFSFVYENSSLFVAFDMPKNMDKPIILGLRLLYFDVMDIYRLFVDEVMQGLNRQREYESDSFATKLGYGEDLIDAIVELNKENLGYPYYDKWYWYFHSPMPSLLQRIEEIEEEMRRMQWIKHNH